MAPLPPPDVEMKKFGVNPSLSPKESKRVLVVYNVNSPISRKIAEYYGLKRKIPRGQVIGVDCLDAEQVGETAYRADIENKVRAVLGASSQAIDFIVLTKGIPLRVGGEHGYSVDAKLVAMDRDGEPIPELLANVSSTVAESALRRNANPYYEATERFSARKYNMRLVTRLDGYKWEHIKKLVDNSLAAKPLSGPFFFDSADNRKGGGYGEMQDSMVNAHKMLKGAGADVILETTGTFLNPGKPLMGYCSWGSNDGKFDVNAYRGLRFLPGAIAETFVSTSGRTMLPAEKGQSLIADLIAGGVTGVKGYVSEPYTMALCRADLLFTRYLNGFNLAESFYAATPLVHWKDIVIGDPLCNPYAKAAK